MPYLRRRNSSASFCGVPPGATSRKAVEEEHHPSPESTNSRLSSANAASQDDYAAGWRVRNPCERRGLFREHYKAVCFLQIQLSGGYKF